MDHHEVKGNDKLFMTKMRTSQLLLLIIKKNAINDGGTSQNIRKYLIKSDISIIFTRIGDVHKVTKCFLTFNNQ